METKDRLTRHRQNGAEQITAKEMTTANAASAWQEQVRKRAYELYLARNGGPGSEVQDWLQAQAELAWKLDH
jgi:hypothetical protein